MRSRTFVISALLLAAVVIGATVGQTNARLELRPSAASSGVEPALAPTPSSNLADESGGTSGSLSVASAVRYRIDASQSKFMVKAYVGGFLSVFGHDHNIAIKDLAGEALVTPDTIEPASLQLTIRSESLTVTDKVSEKDKKEIEATMRGEVLETSTYPEIVFKSTSVIATRTGDGQYQAKIWGDLTLHGVTRSGLIYANVGLSGNTLRARGEFPLRQTDYNIKPVSVAGGTVKVKNELRLSFDIVANK
ncbi:MAG TPA: YceI family protein [Blastocatellia bacterium]|nr:YceI family protein [Blastocatellia bacterium]